MKKLDGGYTPRLNGIKHWVKVEGRENDTIPLILLHGGPGGNHYTFERTIGPFLSRFRTVVYYEQRGCGRSDQPVSDEDYSIPILIDDFKALLKWLGVEKVDLLGYSFGGELALEIAHALGESIYRIILSGPSLMNSEINKMVQISGFLSIGDSILTNQILSILSKRLMIDEAYTKVWSLVDQRTVDLLLFEDQNIAKRNRELWEESNLENTGLMMKALQRKGGDVSLLEWLPELSQRILILTGVFDRNTGIPVSKLISNKLPNCKIVVFQRSAHFPDLEETDKFASEVEAFLQEKLKSKQA